MVPAHTLMRIGLLWTPFVVIAYWGNIMRFSKISLVFLLGIIFVALAGCGTTAVKKKSSISMQAARQYQGLRPFLKGYLSDQLSRREMIFININQKEWEQKGRYIYRAEIDISSAIENVNTLVWPRNQLKIFCHAHGGEFEDNYGGALAPGFQINFSKSDQPYFREAMLQALKKKAFGQKLCRLNERESWLVSVSYKSIQVTRMGDYDIYIIIHDISGYL